MFEIEIDKVRHIFNPGAIAYITLGDESLPSAEAMCVGIVFTNGKTKWFSFTRHADAERLYERLLELI